jgi:hypothetical protein
MRAAFLIVAVVLAGLALAWAIWTPPYPAPATAPSRSVRADNGRVTLAPTPPASVGEQKTVDAGAVAANPVDAKPVEVMPVAPKSIDVKPSVANPVDATPADVPASANPVEPEKTDVSPATDAPKAEPDAPAPDDSAASDDTTDPASTDAGSEDETDGANGDSSEHESSETSIDPGRAADLLADWMAREDAASADDSGEPPSGQALSTFDHEEADPDWSEATAQQIEATLRAWLEALPAEVRAHMALIHVECRQTLCQILAADDDGASQAERAESSHEWQQAMATLPQQSWWAPLGFVSYQTMVANDASGYLLYQAYLHREVKPAG